MEDLNKTITLMFAEVLNDHEISYLRTKLSSVDGIGSIHISTDFVRINYNPFQITGEYVKNIMNYLGFEIEAEKKPGRFKRFVTFLAKGNRKTFGNKKLDCCDLER